MKSNKQSTKISTVLNIIDKIIRAGTSENVPCPAKIQISLRIHAVW